MKIVVDTHIIIRASTRDLSDSRLELIESPSAKLYVSCISLWEITKLVEYRRIEIEEGLDYFLERIYRDSPYTTINLAPEVLKLIPSISSKVGKDPADQIIVATALHLGAKLMSDDKRIVDSKLVAML